jgi:hypothetical protein
MGYELDIKRENYSLVKKCLIEYHIDNNFGKIQLASHMFGKMS